MRVAIFTDNDFDKINGVTTTLRALLRFVPADVQPRIYTAAREAVDTASYFAAASVGLGLPWYREMRIYWPRLREIRRAVIKDGVDVVHVTTPGPVGLAGRLLARQLGLPLVGSYHTQLGDYAAVYSGSRHVGAVLERFLRWFYAPCQKVYVPSDATRDLLVARGYRQDRLDLWTRGVDAEEFSPTRRSFTLRQRWGAGEPRPVILYAGRLSREKGLEMIAPIRRMLLRHGLQYRFVFAGDGPMRAELEEQCPDGVFLGSVPHDKMGAIMASSDIFLFPSTTDTLGNVVLEAQACSLPVLVSDRGGPHQHMRPGVSGIVSPAGDTEAFARAVRTLLTQPATRRAMGGDAREYACGHSWSRTLAPLVNGWRDVSRAAPIQRTESASPDSHSVTAIASEISR